MTAEGSGCHAAAASDTESVHCHQESYTEDIMPVVHVL
jgi:hypothetical protein